MKLATVLISGAVIAAAVATTAFSGAHADKATLAAVKARQAQMTLYSFNAGLLFGMAKGDVPYDADAASAAASNLAAQAGMNQSRYWPPGSDADTLGDVTRAKAEIWQSGSKVGEKGKAFGEAVTALNGAAGGGLDSLRAAIGPVGKACGACHEDYRVPAK